MFENLQENLNEVFKKLRGKGKISEKNISDALREIRMSLLEADVEFSVAKDFIANVRQKAIGQKVIRSVQPGQQIVKIFQDELAKLIAPEEEKELDLNRPTKILVIGLNGAGKTTTCAKLALHIKKQGRTPHLIACDLYRPAAIEQLKILAKQVDVPIFAPENKQNDLSKHAKNGLKWAKKQNAHIQIYDTAGRQEVNQKLLDELKELKKIIEPSETFLVADSATGQQAVNVAKTFDQAIGISGIILTKLDGDARGGAALSMSKITGIGIRYAGIGERIEQFEKFDAERIAGRILGMGDIVGLVETASQAIEEKEAKRLANRMNKRNFDLDDFLAQINMMKKMGPISGIIGMLPGANKLKSQEIAQSETRIKKTEAIILSMTPKERSRPIIIKGRRKKRIALGSGTTIPDVNALLRQFSLMKKMMSKKGKMRQLMAQMGGGGMPNISNFR